MSKPKNIYPNINMLMTGQRLKKLIFEKGFTVKDIQNHLQLSCPQPVYRWMRGEILPSVDHLYVLSKLFGVHMEDMLVSKNMPADAMIFESRKNERRHLLAYYEHLKKIA